MYEKDFREALSEDKDKETLFYGEIISAPILNTDTPYRIGEDDITFEGAEDSDESNLLNAYPIISLRAVSPQTETVKVGKGTGQYLLYPGAALIALAILSAIVRRILVTKIKSDISHQ